MIVERNEKDFENRSKIERNVSEKRRKGIRKEKWREENERRKNRTKNKERKLRRKRIRLF